MKTKCVEDQRIECEKYIFERARRTKKEKKKDEQREEKNGIEIVKTRIESKESKKHGVC